MKDYIDNEDLADGYELYGWKADNSCPSGSLSWYSNSHDCVIYATPNWHTEGVVPFTVTDCETGDWVHVGDLSLEAFKGDIQTQKRVYTNFLKFVISNYDVYSTNLQPA